MIARRLKTSEEVAAWVKEIHYYERDGQNKPSIESISSIPASYPEIAANAALGLITVAVSLLDRQIAAQADSFENEGGFTERLYRVRHDKRKSYN